MLSTTNCHGCKPFPNTASTNGRLPSTLEPLIGMPNWVLWKWEQKGDKWTKVPYRAKQPDVKASSTNPRTWSSFDIAVAAEHRADGIGFMLLNSGIGAFDVDDCRTPDTGVLHEWAIALDQRAGTYAEATVSGTGIRIIGLATGDKVHRKQMVSAPVSCETYRKAERFIVMTGNALGEPRALVNIDSLIDEVVAELDGAAKKKRTNGNGAAGHASGKGQSAVPPKLIELIADTKAAASRPHVLPGCGLAAQAGLAARRHGRLV